MKLNKFFSFVFPDLIRDPGLKKKSFCSGSQTLPAGRQVKFGMTVMIALFLSGCDLGYEIQTLEEYLLDNNYVQEQNSNSVLSSDELDNSSYGELSAWAASAFKNRCDWYNLDRVVDGDTIIIEDGRERVRVRMIGIDTPESKKEGTPIEAYALDASAALKDFLENENRVCLVFDRDGDQYDTYGRRLSYAFRVDGLDLNAQMIKDGWAEAYTRFPMERAREFESLERVARKEGVGQWE